jgi:hypothetical protein
MMLIVVNESLLKKFYLFLSYNAAGWCIAGLKSFGFILFDFLQDDTDVEFLFSTWGL